MDSNYIDPVLASVLAIAYSTESAELLNKNSFSITLNIGGMLVSGELISVRRYYDEVLTGAIGNAIDKVIKDPEMNKSNTSLEDFFKKETQNYIHLKNTKFVVPGQKTLSDNTEGILWRGKTSAIEGYFFGSVG